MAHPRNADFLLEARDETLTIRDVNLRDEVPKLSQIEGMSVKNGMIRRLCTVGAGGLGDKGSFSLYAGAEKIGTLNWNLAEDGKNSLIDWTPLSKNFRTRVFDRWRADELCTEIRLMVARPGMASMRMGGASRLGLSCL